MREQRARPGARWLVSAVTGRPAASVTRTRVSAGLSVSLKTKLRAGVRFALEQVRELGLWMLCGVLLGTAVETFIPQDTFTHWSPASLTRN